MSRAALSTGISMSVSALFGGIEFSKACYTSTKSVAAWCVIRIKYKMDLYTV